MLVYQQPSDEDRGCIYFSVFCNGGDFERQRRKYHNYWGLRNHDKISFCSTMVFDGIYTVFQRQR